MVLNPLLTRKIIPNYQIDKKTLVIPLLRNENKIIPEKINYVQGIFQAQTTNFPVLFNLRS